MCCLSLSVGVSLCMSLSASVCCLRMAVSVCVWLCLCASVCVCPCLLVAAGVCPPELGKIASWGLLRDMLAGARLVCFSVSCLWYVCVCSVFVCVCLSACVFGYLRGFLGASRVSVCARVCWCLCGWLAVVVRVCVCVSASWGPPGVPPGSL